MTMERIILEQGSDHWLAWRAGKSFTDLNGKFWAAIADGGPRITATAGSVIVGQTPAQNSIVESLTHPFATPYELYGRYIGTRAPEESNFAMERGQMMELGARSAYCNYVGEEYQPLCVQSTEHPWIGASLDGIDTLQTRGVEIKCPLSDTSHDLAKGGLVPSYYYDQIQWQHLACDNLLELIDYFSYKPNAGVAAPIAVRPDPVRQQYMIEQALLFRVAVMNRVSLTGSDFDQAARTYLLLNRQIKALESMLEQSKDRLKTLANGKSAAGNGVLVTVADVSGRASWEKVAKAIIAETGFDAQRADAIVAQYTTAPKQTVTIREAADADECYKNIVQVQETSIALPQQDEENEFLVNLNW